MIAAWNKFDKGDCVKNNQGSIRIIHSVEFRTQRYYLEQRDSKSEIWDWIPFSSVEFWEKVESIEAEEVKIKREIGLC